MWETIQHLSAHWNDTLLGAAFWMIFSAAAHALPEPLPMGSRFYLFLYRFIHGVFMNLDRARTTAARKETLIVESEQGDMSIIKTERAEKRGTE